MALKPADDKICSVTCTDPEKVEQLKKRLANLDVMVDIFKAMGDDTRFKLIYALWHGELCVCDLAQVVDMTVAAVSYHLRYLRNLRLVRCDKRGKFVYYRLDDDHIADLVSIALAHSREERNRKKP